MENRFGLKDLVNAVLLVAILISMWLGMKQYDRQWDELKRMQASLEQQNQELRQVGNDINSFQRIAAASPPSTPDTKMASTTQNSQPPVARGSADPSFAAANSPFNRILAAQNMAGYAQGDWLVDSFSVAVAKLTPLVATDAYQSEVEGYVLESLAARDPETLEWEPMLAESWTISEDGLTISFTLRPNIRFSDGTPITSKDVVYTYDLTMNPKINAPRSRAYFDKVASVTADGPRKVIFKFREPYFKSFEICGGMGIMPANFYSKFSEQEFNESPGLLVGSGPYQLKDDPTLWKPGTGAIELVRNERYWGVRPAFDRLVFRELSDEAAKLVAFRNQEIDQFTPTPEQYPQLKKDEDLRAKANFFEYETMVGGYRYVAWNQVRNSEPSIFADARVRRALTLLANREEMCQTLMAGLATPASGPFNRLGPQANPDVKPWPYDSAQAMALLKDAGFADRDHDSILEDSKGRPFRFKLIYPSSSKNYEQMAFYLKDAYLRAGIILEPDPLEWTIMLQRIEQCDFDAMTLGWSGTIEGDPFQIFHSSQIGNGKDNYISYKNEKLDALIDAARVTMDEDKRMKIWHDVHTILHEDEPYTFLWTTKAVQFVHKRILNVQQIRLGLNPEQEWYVPTGKQLRGH